MGKTKYTTYNLIPIMIPPPPPTGGGNRCIMGQNDKINFDNNWIYKPGNKLGTLVLLDKTNATEKALMKDILKKIGIKDHKIHRSIYQVKK